MEFGCHCVKDFWSSIVAGLATFAFIFVVPSLFSPNVYNGNWYHCRIWVLVYWVLGRMTYHGYQYLNYSSRLSSYSQHRIDSYMSFPSRWLFMCLRIWKCVLSLKLVKLWHLFVWMTCPFNNHCFKYIIGINDFIVYVGGG